MVKESRGNDRLYTYLVTGLVRRESEVNERKQKWEIQTIPPTIMLSAQYPLNDGKAHASRLASMRISVISKPLQESKPLHISMLKSNPLYISVLESNPLVHVCARVKPLAHIHARSIP